MSKILIFLAFLVGSSFFMIEASSTLEVEIDKESERIIESMGWLRPDKISYQEQIQIIIDHTNERNQISVGMLATNPNDIRFPDYIENIANEPRIVSFMITNQFACVPNEIERACVIVDVQREGLGDNIAEIRENAREIADSIVGGGVIAFGPDFDSVLLKQKTNNQGEKVFVARVLYTINKQPTHDLFLALSTMLLSTDIRNGGGFYNHAEELSKNSFSSFTIALTPQENRILRSLQISLACSDTLIELVDCPRDVSEQIKKDYEYTRGNLYSLIEKGQEALNGILEVAEGSQHARSYEVAGQIIKSVGDTTDKLIDLQTKMKELNKEEKAKGPSTVNNALFVGSTSELSKLLKKGVLNTTVEEESE